MSKSYAEVELTRGMRAAAAYVSDKSYQDNPEQRVRSFMAFLAGWTHEPFPEMAKVLNQVLSTDKHSLAENQALQTSAQDERIAA